MPTMHRLSCLRDDLIFFIYLYQRWAYGVDAKRANEFGQVELDDDEQLKLAAAAAADAGAADAVGGAGGASATTAQ